MTDASITVNIGQQPDWLTGVLLPASAILVSAAIAIGLAALERRASARAQTRAQAVLLIRALNGMGRAALLAPDQMIAAYAKYEGEVNSFAAFLNKRDVVVAKFISIMVDRSDDAEREKFFRTMVWLVTALELWLRGNVSTKHSETTCPPTQRPGWSEWSSASGRRSYEESQ